MRTALPVLCHALIVLLLLISRNVHVHPGPSTAAVADSDFCFTDFCPHKSLGFLHVNTRSLLPEMDQLKAWVHSSNPDVLVITETWLRKSVLNTFLVRTFFVKTDLPKVVEWQSLPRNTFLAWLLGDLNGDMLKPPDHVLKQWDSLNLSQITTNSTRYDSKHPENAPLLNVILANIPDRY